jgi:hypothetical protein
MNQHTLLQLHHGAVGMLCARSLTGQCKPGKHTKIPSSGKQTAAGEPKFRQLIENRRRKKGSVFSMLIKEEVQHKAHI